MWGAFKPKIPAKAMEIQTEFYLLEMGNCSTHTHTQTLIYLSIYEYVYIHMYCDGSFAFAKRANVLSNSILYLSVDMFVFKNVRDIGYRLQAGAVRAHLFVYTCLEFQRNAVC